MTTATYHTLSTEEARHLLSSFSLAIMPSEINFLRFSDYLLIMGEREPGLNLDINTPEGYSNVERELSKFTKLISYYNQHGLDTFVPSFDLGEPTERNFILETFKLDSFNSRDLSYSDHGGEYYTFKNLIRVIMTLAATNRHPIEFAKGINFAELITKVKLGG